MQFVHKQCIPDQDIVTFLDHYLGLDTCEIVGNECILARALHAGCLQCSLAFQINVQTFTQFDNFCHILDK